MDGNGRWAEGRGLPRLEGHRRGAVAARRVIAAAGENSVPWLTLYAFSTENWSRPVAERRGVFHLMMESLRDEISNLVSDGVRFRLVGDPSPLPDRLRRLITEAEERSAGQSALNLSVCMNYSGQEEIIRAVRRIISSPPSGGVDGATVKAALDTAALPPVDLLLRTGGEARLSNFLLWDSAYAELFFTDTLWPDFTTAEFASVLAGYSERERRFGRV
ncbi:di-trans,poly-cis-decaprenylcistransferase [bacterium]|nr:di-trans,poly-cis-decaprenylcistransferase [bacterium]